VLKSTEERHKFAEDNPFVDSDEEGEVRLAFLLAQNFKFTKKTVFLRSSGVIVVIRERPTIRVSFSLN